MKKKIKDLTKKDCDFICENTIGCVICPLFKTSKCHARDKIQFNKKVEVDE